MSALDKLPPALRTRSSIVTMANQLDRARYDAGRLRSEARKPPGVIKVAIPTIGGAFAAGYMDATFPGFANGRTQPSTAAGVATVTAGYFMESEWAIYAGVGMLTPQGYAAGVKAAGYDLVVIETTAEPGEPEAVAA